MVPKVMNLFLMVAGGGEFAGSSNRDVAGFPH